MANYVDLIQYVRGMEEQAQRPFTLAEWQMKMQQAQAEMADRAAAREMERKNQEMNLKLKEQELKSRDEDRKLRAELLKESKQSQFEVERAKQAEQQRAQEALMQFGRDYANMQTGPAATPEQARSMVQPSSDAANQLLQMGLGMGGMAGLNLDVGGATVQPMEQKLTERGPRTPSQQEVIAKLLASGMAPQQMKAVGSMLPELSGEMGEEEMGKPKGLQLLRPDLTAGVQPYYDPNTRSWGYKEIPGPRATEVGEEQSPEMQEAIKQTVQAGEAATPANVSKTLARMRKSKEEEGKAKAEASKYRQEQVAKQLNEIHSEEVIKDFKIVDDSTRDLEAYLSEVEKEVQTAKAQGRQVKVAPIQRLLGYKISKLSDPKTGVRDTELRDTLQNSSGIWTQTANWWKNFAGDTADYTTADNTLRTVRQVIDAIKAAKQAKLSNINRFAQERITLIGQFDPEGAKMLQDALAAGPLGEAVQPTATGTPGIRWLK